MSSTRRLLAGLCLASVAPLLALAPAPAAAAARPFVIGTDLSYLPMLDGFGAAGASPFRAAAGGPTGDALAMAAAGGATHVRLRLWVEPLARNPSGWPARNADGSADDSYANLTGVLGMARRIVANNLSLWLDLHYSDTWADPGHQTKPRAWASLAVPELAAAVAAHTTAALSALAAQGTPADIVQVGNEISAGMLWAGAGQACAQGGALFAAGCDQAAQWAVFGGQLMAAGLRAARAAQPGALLVVHSDLGNKLNTTWGASYIVTFYKDLASSLGEGGTALFDAIGLSYYPNWGAGPSTNVAKLAAVRDAFPDKAILLAETSWPYQGGGSPWDEFPRTPAGQAAYARSVAAQVRALAGGAGLAWWGAEFYNQTSGAGWTSLWDEQGVALPALSAFQ